VGPPIAIAATLALGLGLGIAQSATAAPFRGPDSPIATRPAIPGSSYASKSGLSAKQLRRQLAKQVHAQSGIKGVKVVDLDAHRHRTLFASSPGRSMILASNSKLFTTAAFLEHYGPRQRFATRLWVRGHRTGAAHRRLHGSLVLVGAGDPALAAGSFGHSFHLPLTRIGPLAKAVKKAGIRRLDGDIRADPTIFDSQRMPSETGITPENELGSLSGLEYDSGFKNGLPVASPAKEAGDALRNALKAAGVKVKGRVQVGGAPASLLKTKPLGSVKSPPTASLIAQVNTPSNDTWAEMLTKRLAAGAKRQGTTARGVKRIKGFARGIGVSVQLENGSGLSRLNRSSPSDVVKLLGHMNGVKDGATYRRSLAVPCHSGTVAQRMCGTAADGNCRTKTGTLRDVSALSGYCQAGRHRLAFSILMNAVTNFDEAHKGQDRMAALIARYRP
jgi:D-alanyl-D-alanine carboxypeptidase/D-alanyl-D-alanine-endopeptidase (penicillin-binding protein 4)